jgi:hypothetical protein
LYFGSKCFFHGRVQGDPNLPSKDL